MDVSTSHKQVYLLDLLTLIVSMADFLGIEMFRYVPSQKQLGLLEVSYQLELTET